MHLRSSRSMIDHSNHNRTVRNQALRRRCPSARLGTSGATNLGCLLTLAIGILVGYVLIRVIQVEQRYVAMRSAVAREAVEARDQTDERVIQNLQAKARELGLPQRAQAVFVSRDRDTILVSVRWSDTMTFWKLDWIRGRVVESKAPIW